MTSNNAERFLNSFRTIEEILTARSAAKGRSRRTFSELVDGSKLLIQDQKKLLRGMAVLRNAIVHTPYLDDRPIADPRDETVAAIERQASLLENPPLVRNVLKLQPPQVLRDDQEISSFLDLVLRLDFSQAPVSSEGLLQGLVTTNAVARWLAASYENAEGALLESASIKDVMARNENTDSVLFKSKNLKVIEAIRAFSGEDGNTPPAAILITDSGAASEKPLGICVRADVQALYSALSA